MSYSSITADPISPTNTGDTATAVDEQGPRGATELADTPCIHPKSDVAEPSATAPTPTSVDEMAEELSIALLARGSAATVRLFSVDEYDGKFAQILKRFSRDIAEKVYHRRMAIVHGEIPRVTKEDHEEWKREFGKLIHKRWELLVYYVWYLIKLEKGSEKEQTLEVEDEPTD